MPDLETQPHERRMISARKAAARLGVHESLLSQWKRDGKGPPRHEFEGVSRYDSDELEQWIAANRVK